MFDFKGTITKVSKKNPQRFKLIRKNMVRRMSFGVFKHTESVFVEAQWPWTPKIAKIKTLLPNP